MGKYSLPKVVDSYSVEEICKMKNLQIRPYAMCGLPLEGVHKSFKEELVIVSHILHNKLFFKHYLSEMMNSRNFVCLKRISNAIKQVIMNG